METTSMTSAALVRRFLGLGGLLAVAGGLACAVVACLGPVGPETVLRGHKGPVETVVYSPDGLRLATTGADRSARLWEAVTGREVATLNVGPRDGPVDVLGFSPDGALLATAGEGRPTVWIWDAATGALEDRRGASDCPSWASRRGDGLTSPDTTARVEPDRPLRARRLTLVHAATGRPFAKVAGHPDRLNAARFSPDGRLLATAGGHAGHDWPVGGAGEVRLWNTRDGRPRARLDGIRGAVNDLAFSPDGQFLAAACHDARVRIWRVASVLDPRP